MKKMKSLFDIINSSLIEGVLPENFSLPSIDDGKIKWADGAMDGVAIYHMGRTEADEKDLALMEEAVRASAASDYDKAVELFTELGKQKRALELIDDVQKFIIEHSDELPARNVFKTSVDIITKSDDRECVKYGLSMLEVKSADNTRAKSLRIYMETYKPEYAIKLSAKNFGFEDGKKIVPLYAAFCI